MAALMNRKFCHFRRGVALLFKRNQCSPVKYSVKDVITAPPIGKKIHVLGWIKSIRKQKENTFLDINDGLCLKTLQVVAKTTSIPSQVNYGCSVEVIGELTKSTHAAQSIELKCESIEILGACSLEEYPLHPREIQSADFTRKYLHLRPRTKTFSSFLRIRSAVHFAIHEFFQKQDFIHIDTPILTTNNCEGAGDVFHVKPLLDTTHQNSDKSSHFFDSDVFLTVSAQFHLEAMACSLSNVYTMGPTFRAENSRTRHHLSEFHMLEAEMVLSGLPPLLEFMELLIKSVTREVLEVCAEDVDHLHKQAKCKVDLDRFINKHYVRLTYTEAIHILEKNQDLEPIKWGEDMTKPHEQFLVRFCDNIPVFIVEYPSEFKPFYMKISDENSKTVEAVDLLVSEVGELCGGSVREHHLDKLSNRIDSLGARDSLLWYLDLRKFGTVPHVGFGMGLERYLQSILGVNNIKDTIPFPRWPHHCNQ